MAEHGIKSLSHVLMKHLTGLGEDWPMYCKPAMLALQLICYPKPRSFESFQSSYWKKSYFGPEV